MTATLFIVGVGALVAYAFGLRIGYDIGYRRGAEDMRRIALTIIDGARVTLTGENEPPPSERD